MKKMLTVMICILLSSPYTIAAEQRKNLSTIEFNAQKGLTGYYNKEKAIAFVGDTKYTQVIVVPENSRPKKTKKHEFIGKLTHIKNNGTSSQEFDMYGIKKNTDPIDNRPDGTVRVQEREEENLLF